MIRAFGESALLVEVDSADRAQAFAASLRRKPLRGVAEAVPGLASVLVELQADAPPGMEARLADRLRDAQEVALTGRQRVIPVVYGGEHGPDLAEVARLSGLAEADVVAAHASAELGVLFLGFAPGFAYLGDLPEKVAVPRLSTPRTRTPAGSVAIAERMSGIYPADLPGGWRVIGRTPIRLFDPLREPPTYLAPGDRVRFEPIAPGDWDERTGTPDDW